MRRSLSSKFEVVIVQSSSLKQHMNQTSPLVRAKSNAVMATIVVDMGNRGGDADLLRLKSNNALDAYSPAKKSAPRPENVSRIHCIPLLMVLVFFILWTASSEILPEKTGSMPELLALNLNTATHKMTTSEEQQPEKETSQHGMTTMLNHNQVYYRKTDDDNESQSLSLTGRGSDLLRGVRT